MLLPRWRFSCPRSGVADENSRRVIEISIHMVQSEPPLATMQSRNRPVSSLRDKRPRQLGDPNQFAALSAQNSLQKKRSATRQALTPIAVNDKGSPQNAQCGSEGASTGTFRTREPLTAIGVARRPRRLAVPAEAMTFLRWMLASSRIQRSAPRLVPPRR